jgi:hypothetical protein
MGQSVRNVQMDARNVQIVVCVLSVLVGFG